MIAQTNIKRCRLMFMLGLICCLMFVGTTISVADDGGDIVKETLTLPVTFMAVVEPALVMYNEEFMLTVLPPIRHI